MPPYEDDLPGAALTAVESFFTPLGLAFALAMGLLLIILPRRYALLPVIALTCFMPMSQEVFVTGFHFTMLRILLLFGWARVVMRLEFLGIKLNPIDKAVLWWALSGLVINTVLWQTSDALVNRLGQGYNTIGTYFLFRFLVRDVGDIKRVFKITATLIVPLAAAMLVEWVTRRNVFAIFGVTHPLAQIRDGILRCQGPFLHPILAGTFAATQLPFFVALWQQGRSRLLAAIAILSSTVITLTTGSSAPIMTYLFAVVGLAMWPWRGRMRAIRWGLSLVLVSLHLVMKAPVWFLIARIDVLSGSTGFHRAYLIDRFVATFSQWWLLGMKSAEAFGEQIHGDITNEYVWQGMSGGLLTLVLFILIIVRCFRGVGGLQALAEEPLPERRCVWALGASLLSHVVTYLSIQYFDQNFVNWYLLLALISTATGQFLNAPHREPVTASQLPSPAQINSDQVSSDTVSLHSQEAYWVP